MNVPTFPTPAIATKKIAYLGYTGIIDPAAATRIAATFNATVNQAYDEVHLCFSSVGGTVADGVYLYNLIRGLPIKTVFYNIGSVASIALTIFLAAEERYCSSHSVFMTHPTSFNPQEMTAVRAKTLLAASLADDDRIEKILRDRTTCPKSVLRDRRIKDVHIKPVDAVRYGIALAVKEFALPRGNQIIQI